jgi:hypothetical protein
MPTPIKLAVCHTLGDLKSAVEMMLLDATLDTEILVDNSFYHAVEISSVKHGDGKIRVNIKILNEDGSDHDFFRYRFVD